MGKHYDMWTTGGPESHVQWGGEGGGARIEKVAVVVAANCCASVFCF